MPQDFSSQNLRGRNFKGQNLAGVNFSYADIRGTNFTGANLTGANFTGAKAGLQRRWAIILVIISLLLSVLSGVNSWLIGGGTAYLFLPKTIKDITIIPGVIFLIVLAVFFIITIRQGIVAVALVVAVAVAIALAVAVAIAIAVAVAVAGALAGALAGAVGAGALAVVAIAGAVAVVAIAGTLTVVAGAGALAAAVALVLAATGVAMVRTVAVVGAVAIALAVAVAVAGVVVGIYIAWRALAGDEKHALIRNLAVAFAAIGGTSFQGANLTDANFTQARLKSTDFRDANLTRTRFYEVDKTYKLERIRVGKTILANSAIRTLLVTGNGRNKSYVGANLAGANLIGADLKDANLKEANISDATFQEANLEGANLTLTQAINTNFTYAQMTGACLEAWNIENSTKLENVDCRFIYLLEHPKPGTDDRERRPSSGEFAPREFTKLFEEVLNTVDLIFRNGVDWKAFVSAFKKVQVENGDTELVIQSIENKSDNVVVVKVSVPPNTNKEKIHSDFTQNYKVALKALEEKYKVELKAKDEQIVIYREKSSEMKEIISLLASRPVSITNEVKAESKSMSDSIDKSQNIKVGGDVTGSTLNIGEISGVVSNTINQLPASFQPEKPGIKELLTQLKTAIDAEKNLSDEDKAQALEQVQVLAEAGKQPQEKQNQAKGAIRFFKGLVTELPTATKFVEACGQLIPAIAKLFGLG